ncbi:MAG: hypothetical protein JXB36_17720, partial [Gammaproteobacteria bacterium]|nr:hypothetical protein [Gammaproteobacteria bacterium]
MADRFLYFNDENFGLSELVATLRGMSTSLYPVTVDLAHRGNPGSARLNGATPNFVFEYDELKKYHQIWIMAAETRLFSPISDDERQAIRRFMDEGGGVFATGDHEDLGVTVGGYIPRVRSMRRWFWPNPGPNGEPVAPHGGDATRHDTNRAGHDPGFSFNDQSDDVPQTIAPRYFGGLIQSVHPVLCTPQGPIRVLPDHPHEGECVVPHNLGAHYSIGGHSEREYPDGPGGTPLPPVVIATSTMIPGAETAGKPPVPGGTFGAIGAWDGHRAGAYGRIVVDATWHHFININLIGDRDLGLPNPAVPKTMGFLHTAAGQAHYDRIRTYFTNIANWLTPRSMRRCWLHRHIWWVTQHGWFLENFRRDDLIQTGRLALELLGWLGPCERISFIHDLFYERELPVPWRGLLDPFAEDAAEIHKQLRGVKREDAQMLAKEMPEAMMGAAAVGFLERDVSIDLLRNEIGDEEA